MSKNFPGGGDEVDPSELDGGTNFDESGVNEPEENVDPSEDKE
jgi:hypothetical protein